MFARLGRLLATAVMLAGPLSVAVGSRAAATRCHARGSGLFVLPDPRCTPGVTDPRVTQVTIGRTICRRGYVRSVRPPESVTEPQKLAAMVAYGDFGSARRYEYDHLIALALGGAPDDSRNLWPEPGATPNPKDRLEDALHRDVCARRLSLAAAQQAVAGNWVAAYRARFG